MKVSDEQMQERRKQIMALLAEGWQQSAIAKKLKISQYSVHYAINYYKPKVDMLKGRNMRLQAAFLAGK